MWFGEISFLKEDLVSDFLVLLFSHLSLLINPTTIKKLASNTSQDETFIPIDIQDPSVFQSF